MSTARSRTASQIAAARPEASVWVSANAGTGKTGVLVDRISRLLLAGVPPERILCLTFTKAAAAEMANRLSDLLSRWSAMDEAALIGELRALGETEVDAALTAKARRLFALTLEAPEGLRIRTIHSFCESLLGRFPLEARINPDFRVMDERDRHELQLQARDQVLVGADAAGTDLTAALRAIATLVDEDGFAGLMRELDAARGKFRRALERHGGTAGLIAAVAAALGCGIDETVPSALRAAAEIGPETEAGLRRLADAWQNGSPTHQGNARTLLTFLARPTEQRADAWEADFVPLFLTAKLEPRTDGSLMSKGAAAHDPGALDIARREVERCLSVLDHLRAIRSRDATAALIRIGAEMIGTYETIKAGHGRLDYDDLIERAAGLLSGKNGISWVHYKLDGGIEHVLVDEAQDTSPEQWHVIDQLASDFFTGESRHQERFERPRTVFAVGDEKQSIYSFQGADPVMFGRMKAQFSARVAGARQTWLPVEMAESFRSTSAVLDVVDAVFAVPENADGLLFGDGKVLHNSARTGQAGQVEVWPAEVPDEQDGEDLPWDTPLDYISADSPEGRVAARIAGTIQGWLDKGEMLPAQGRKVRPGDILILVQKRKRLAELLVATLKSRGVPVSGRDRMVLPDQMAIQDLIALGRLALLPEDDLNTACVLKGPLIGLDDDALFGLAHGRSGTLLASLRAQRSGAPAFERAWDRIAEWRRRADFLPPFEFFSQILDAEHGRRDLLARLGPEAAEPIDDFLAAALDYERDHVPSLEGFLHWLETGDTEVKRDLEQGRDEVRVMTVHGSKGLQAEIVFLADACTVPSAQNSAQIHWFAEQGVPVWPGYSANQTAAVSTLKETRRREIMSEYRRLLYVALTRAKDRLYVTGFKTQRESKETSWHEMVSAAVLGLGREVAEPDGRTRLVFEKPQSAVPDGRPVDAAAGAAAAPVPDWAVRAPAPEPEPSRPLSPSRPDDAEPAVRSPLDADDGARFQRGLAVHALMQTLPDLPVAGRRAAAKAYLARPLFGFDATAQAEILGEVLAILTAPEIAPLFGPGSRAEVPVAGTIDTATGPRVISGQIDRLVQTADAVLIVDYKTNRPPPTDPASVPVIYLRQMATYRAALAPIFPGIPVRCVLLWTDGPNWMELPDHLLDGYAP